MELSSSELLAAVRAATPCPGSVLSLAGDFRLHPDENVADELTGVTSIGEAIALNTESLVDILVAHVDIEFPTVVSDFMTKIHDRVPFDDVAPWQLRVA